ncbi:DUF1617 family protein [Alkalicoccobacillus murimartini]|uniref:RNase H-like nuclease (RuvC/YqgF family) n=1 Tax=Alkalicoccobacillus murimartini TaxID=171685 RepID=A0ABT9YFN6_9BACI|nr:DUF1617 family protein [Alkalicoccobacillus murimartini]MDQ0206662.1 putative RNase H-like nuclease (RuvC/YqgF family) [Alkalicoccobacillus murimartini]
MQVKIENAKIGQVIDLLFDLSLKGKESRHRSKFIKELNDRLQEVAEEEQELIKEHCHLDEDEKPKMLNDGKEWDVKDIEAFKHDKLELYQEEFILEGGNVTGYLKTIKDIVVNCEKEFSGQEATLYDYLYDQLEEVE